MLRDKAGTSGDDRLARPVEGRVSSRALAMLPLLFSVQLCACERAPVSPPPESAAVPSLVAPPGRPLSRRGPSPAPLPEILATSARKVSFREDLARDIPTQLSESKIEKTILPVKEGMWVALDDHPPRQKQGEALRLEDLLSEDQEIAPGPHTLSFFLVDDTTVQIQARSLIVGASMGQKVEPGCVLWTGRLTFNGPEQIAEMSALAIPTDPLVSEFSYEAQNEEGETIARSVKLSVGNAARLPSSLAGDIEWSVSCFIGTERVGESRRLVTLNPESNSVEKK